MATQNYVQGTQPWALRSALQLCCWPLNTRRATCDVMFIDMGISFNYNVTKTQQQAWHCSFFNADKTTGKCHVNISRGSREMNRSGKLVAGKGEYSHSGRRHKLLGTLCNQFARQRKHLI